MQTLRRLSPEQVVFYASGRASLEASFMYQLFARAYGSNNLPDSSNMCHESTSVALPESIGVPVGTVTLNDFEHTDCLLFFGQNVGSNSPRMLHQLQEARQRDVPIITFNPLKERGLQAPELPAELRPKDPQAAPTRSGQTSLTPEQQRHHALAAEQLAPGLRARGLDDERIDRVSAAAVSHAQAHAHRGEVRAFHLSKDGERIAMVQASAPVSETTRAEVQRQAIALRQRRPAVATAAAAAAQTTAAPAAAAGRADSVPRRVPVDPRAVSAVAQGTAERPDSTLPATMLERFGRPTPPTESTR